VTILDGKDHRETFRSKLALKLESDFFLHCFKSSVYK